MVSLKKDNKIVRNNLYVRKHIIRDTEKLECEKVMGDALEDSESWYGIIPCALTATVIYFIIWYVAELFEFITK